MFLIYEIELLHCCLTKKQERKKLPEVGKPLVVNTVKFLWTDDVLVKIFQYKRDIGNNVQLSTDYLKFSKRNSGQSVTVIVTDAELT